MRARRNTLLSPSSFLSLYRSFCCLGVVSVLVSSSSLLMSSSVKYMMEKMGQAKVRSQDVLALPFARLSVFVRVPGCDLSRIDAHGTSSNDQRSGHHE